MQSPGRRKSQCKGPAAGPVGASGSAQSRVAGVEGVRAERQETGQGGKQGGTPKGLWLMKDIGLDCRQNGKPLDSFEPRGHTDKLTKSHGLKPAKLG